MSSRLSLAVLVFFSTTSLPAFAQWWNPLAPSDYEECAEQAAKEAKTTGGLTILLKGCQDKFPARRNPKGKGYVYFDVRQERWIDVSGPTLTQSDRRKIEEAYRKHLEDKCADEERQKAKEEADDKIWEGSSLSRAETPDALVLARN
jgi:hypothetical protein